MNEAILAVASEDAVRVFTKARGSDPSVAQGAHKCSQEAGRDQWGEVGCYVLLNTVRWQNVPGPGVGISVNFCEIQGGTLPQGNSPQRGGDYVLWGK